MVCVDTFRRARGRLAACAGAPNSGRPIPTGAPLNVALARGPCVGYTSISSYQWPGRASRAAAGATSHWPESLMSRWLSSLGLGALALAAVAITVVIHKQSEPPRPDDPTDPPADRGVGLRRVARIGYYTQFSVN